MKRWMFMAASLLLCSGAVLLAEDKVTVSASREDISESLDLKAVANLFGQVKDLSELEQKLNSDSLHLSNLDLNGDGKVDYLRVVETVEESSQHIILIQAVLAEDIYQDVASIYVENKGNDKVTVQVTGDAYIYGKNYVIEPVYIYRPVIYDWFWSPNWVCYNSPWYWNYWPTWYAPYPCWGYTRYWTNVYVYHYDHPRCSYHYVNTSRMQQTSTRNYVSRSDYAKANAGRSFTERTGMHNARELSASRVTSSGSRSVSSYATGSRNTYQNGSTGRNTGSSRTSSSGGGSKGYGYTGSASGSSYAGGSRSSSSYSNSTNNTRNAGFSNSSGNSGSSRSSGSSSSSTNYSGSRSYGGTSSNSGSSSYSGGSRR